MEPFHGAPASHRQSNPSWQLRLNGLFIPGQCPGTSERRIRKAPEATVKVKGLCQGSESSTGQWRECGAVVHWGHPAGAQRHSCHINPSLQGRRAQDELHLGSLWTQGKRRRGNACDVSVTVVGLWPGHRGWLSWAVTSLGHREVSGCSEGAATLVLSLSSEARSPGQRAVGTAAEGVYFNPKPLIPRKREARLL